MAAEEEDVRLSFSHKYQLDKYQIILNNQDIDLKTEQSPQQKGEGDEKATLKKVESMEIWGRREMGPGWCRGEEAKVMEEGQKRTEGEDGNTQRNLWGEHFPIAIGLNFMNSCNQRLIT